MSTRKEFRRLPDTVVPSLYKIFIKPDLVACNFEGNETICISIKAPTKTIVLNSLELAIKSCSLNLSDGQILEPSTTIDKETETLTLDFKSEVPAGTGSLSLEFAGILDDSLKGLYRSKTSTANAPVRYAAVTQFAPTDARKCFPCWDEPAIKAVFELTLSAPPDTVALSNMPCISEKVEGDRKICKFTPSPVMSTYLVAIAVGDYDYIEGESEDGVLVRVYTPPGVKDQGRFALSVATRVLPYYKEYFGIAYPLPKLDLIAVADLAYGAMENWGLVTFKQSCLLLDPENSSSSSKQTIAKIISHELAHQWFGNIVTMEWWTDLWLNEGFASFVEDLCTAHLFPEFDIWSQFISSTLTRALELDCLQNSHPIEVPVNNPSEINEIFDAISYCKGASIIRMLHHFIGDQDFRKGMNLYLTRHQYKNSQTEDLWKALEEASKKPVRAVMSTWTRQLGFPVIRVTSSEQSGSSRIIGLTQEKFTADSSSKPADSEWLIPLAFSCQGREVEIIHSEVISKKSVQITIPSVAPDAWVKLNAGTSGVFRVLYPPELLNQLLPAVVDKTLPPLDRYGLLDDLLAMVKSGRADSADLLRVIAQMKNEENMIVWRVIANSLDQIGIIVAGSPITAELAKFGRYVFKPMVKKVGWEPKPSESHLETLLRSLVLSNLGKYSDGETCAHAKQLFELHVTKQKLIPADIRVPVYRSVVSSGNEETYNTMMKLLREETLQEERQRILIELGALKDEALLKKLIDFTMSDEVRAQDKIYVMVSVARTKLGRDLMWELMRENWDKILKIYEGGFLLPRLVKCCLENFADLKKAEEIVQFFSTVNCSAASRSIEQATESIKINAAWLRRDGEKIKNFLANFQYQ